jgi:hypothetical protein
MYARMQADGGKADNMLINGEERQGPLSDARIGKDI